MQQEQFKKEVLPLRDKLLSYAQRILGDAEEAEDIIQEVYLKLWSMRDSLHSYNSIAALSKHMTKNLCVNRLNSFSVRHRLPESLDGLIVMNEEPEPDIQLEQKDSLKHVMRIIDKLPELQQTILRMKHVEGFDVEEIAELTGSSQEAVRMNLSRARKRVRELSAYENYKK